jgi:hypothetical protein
MGGQAGHSDRPSRHVEHYRSGRSGVCRQPRPAWREHHGLVGFRWRVTYALEAFDVAPILALCSPLMMAAVASRSVGGGKQVAEVGEEPYGRGSVRFDEGPGEGAGSDARESGPRAAGLVRDGQEEVPVIGLAVIKLRGDGGVRGPQRRQVIGDPAGTAAASGSSRRRSASRRIRSTGSPGARRRMGRTMARSSSVAGTRPMSAIMRAPQVENRRGSCPAVRTTKAVARVCPELMMPRSARLLSRKVSASSTMRVGAKRSTVR